MDDIQVLIPSMVDGEREGGANSRTHSFDQGRIVSR